jgi:hypothetical protein
VGVILVVRPLKTRRTLDPPLPSAPVWSCQRWGENISRLQINQRTSGIVGPASPIGDSVMSSKVRRFLGGIAQVRSEHAFRAGCQLQRCRWLIPILGYRKVFKPGSVLGVKLCLLRWLRSRRLRHRRQRQHRCQEHVQQNPHTLRINQTPGAALILSVNEYLVVPGFGLLSPLDSSLFPLMQREILFSMSTGPRPLAPAPSTYTSPPAQTAPSKTDADTPSGSPPSRTAPPRPCPRNAAALRKTAS